MPLEGQTIDKNMGGCGGRWGSTPNPGRGQGPLRPKPRASRLAQRLLLLEMKLRKRGGILRDLTAFFHKPKFPERCRSGVFDAQGALYHVALLAWVMAFW